jgi:outer membrane biogenesis lipoprotein LolB
MRIQKPGVRIQNNHVIVFLLYSVFLLLYSHIKGMKKNFRPSLIVCAVLFLPACAGILEKIPINISGDLQTRDSIEPVIRQTIEILQSKNRDIKTFKGTGRVNYSVKNRETVSSNIAWVAGDENKLLILLRGLLGEPLARIATDGEWLYFFSHADNSYYRKRSANASMESFISIPLKSKDIILLLSGRIPVVEFDSAEIVGHDTGPAVMVLKKRWLGVVEKIYLDESREEAVKVELFDSMGEIIYRASFDGENTVNEYRFPSRLLVSNDRGDSFTIDLERCWTDIPVSPSIFVLNPPE